MNTNDEQALEILKCFGIKDIADIHSFTIEFSAGKTPVLRINKWIMPEENEVAISGLKTLMYDIQAKEKK